MRATRFIAISAFIVLAAPAAHATSLGGVGCYGESCKPKLLPQTQSGGWSGYPNRPLKAGGYGNPDGYPNRPMQGRGDGQWGGRPDRPTQGGGMQVGPKTSGVPEGRCLPGRRCMSGGNAF